MASMADQVAVVTGASHGIGRILTLHLAAAGAAVVAVARPSEELATLTAAGPGAGTIVPVAADVTDPDQVEAAFDAAGRLGTLTLAVTCAGAVGTVGPMWTTDPRHWWDAAAVHLLGTMIVAGAAIRRMLPAGSGRVVTVYGNLGERQSGNVSAFGAAKAGVARLTESLACELEGTGIVVLGLHPGFVRTPGTEWLAYGEEGGRWLPEFSRSAERRWGDGQRAAGQVESIARGAADQLSGRVVHAMDDLVAVTRDCRDDADRRRLRLTFD
jgi:3-oxoacyl-[acyl-carrier protein] reductase